MLLLHRWLVPFALLSFAFVSAWCMGAMSILATYAHLFTLHLLLRTLSYLLLLKKGHTIWMHLVLVVVVSSSSIPNFMLLTVVIHLAVVAYYHVYLLS